MSKTIEIYKEFNEIDWSALKEDEVGNDWDFGKRAGRWFVEIYKTDNEIWIYYFPASLNFILDEASDIRPSIKYWSK